MLIQATGIASCYSMQEPEISVDIQSLDNIDSLLAQWSSLEQKADNSFFLSATWIGTWLETFTPDVNVLRFTQNDALIGLGLFTLTEKRRHLFVNARTIRFHQTGNPVEDQIWIEYNNLLIAQGYENAVAKALSASFLNDFTDWDEINTGLTFPNSSLLTLGCSLYRSVEFSTRQYGVDLNALRKQGMEYRSSLSRNARYQLKKSQQKYQQLGQLRIVTMSNQQEALDCFTAMKPMHLSRWHAQGTSGFANPQFVKFHQKLIEVGIQRNQVELLCLQNGEDKIAYLYNFIYKNKIYFYMSASSDENDKKLKPGLLAHAFAIEQYLSRGFDYYDFMGGDMQYKRSLANDSAKLKSYIIQKNTHALLLERFSILIKNKIVSTGIKRF